ncbi:TOBE domain-containing protein [Saccharopolyspora sp. ASAGF58]|uniref:TOBE domain-containing protein n=1 Tax=Saccharopolyspora sp. ASAGF58 TaxID=2719023 RepID=UPI00211114D9|nr:TOBE domain-containing protein [Saccharopolyspora sp. ASAGF58]
MRPESLRLTDTATTSAWQAEATVALVESTGPSRLVHLDLDSSRVTARCPNELAVHSGQRVAVRAHPRDVQVFEPEGTNLGTADELLATRELTP